MKKKPDSNTGTNSDGLNLETYDDFVENWQQLLEDSSNSELQNSDNSTSDLNKIEKLAQYTFEKLITSDNSNESGHSANSTLQSLHNSAVICDCSAKIIYSNHFALTQQGLFEGSNLSTTKIFVNSGEALSQKISNLRKENVDYSQMQILNCLDQNDASLFIAIMKLPDKSKEEQYLLVFMSTPWNTATENLLTSNFNLTASEIDVVRDFITGVSLKDIATHRNRSHTTIRNQFQSALEKTGCPSQADLLRLLLSSSYLFSQIDKSINEEKTKIGKRLELIRPKGRFLEFTLYGDPQGTPFICLPSIFGFPATADIEKQLKDRNMLMICVSRPGFGDTSHPVTGQELYDCLAEDIKALLDNMGIEQCLLLGRASAARSLFNLVHRIPERFHSAFMVNSLIPRPFIKSDNIISNWTTSLMLATKLAPSVATLILGTGQKMMMKNGAGAFIKKMYRQSTTDCKAAEDPLIMQSIYEGAKLVTKQGLEAGVKDMIDGFEDWSSEVECVNIKVTLIQGRFDPNVPIAGAKQFANFYKDKIDLIEVEDGGGLLNYTHSEKIFDIIQPKQAQ